MICLFVTPYLGSTSNPKIVTSISSTKFTSSKKLLNKEEKGNKPKKKKNKKQNKTNQMFSRRKNCLVRICRNKHLMSFGSYSDNIKRGRFIKTKKHGPSL